MTTHTKKTFLFGVIVGIVLAFVTIALCFAVRLIWR